ncbi:phosphopantetheine-binding protein [Aestuariivirga litoralis]|uniref:Phosphopantetheine-binding protein n=1 Tax=Aestuariivirga litoralis TaxID=2650924 RepID=A0A2W2BM82_9HYPH|nr:phosphopantetheine-binding protein [Aestuariivirga litoralis]PZF77339.1 phosphopantetheine-binding protein [Aestuariivirga litoralis]
MTASDHIEDRLLAIVAREGLIDKAKLTPDATLDSLGIASADVIVILMAVEEEFGAYIPVDSSLSDARTVGDFVVALRPHLEKQRS